MTGSRFNPRKEVANIRDQVNKILEDTFSSGGSGVALDIYETEEAIVVVTAPLPGLLQETVDISITDGQLTIEGETQNPLDIEENAYLRQERKFGSFSRTVTHPAQINAEETRATLTDQILTITIPKMEEAAPRVIKVKPVE